MWHRLDPLLPATAVPSHRSLVTLPFVHPFRPPPVYLIAFFHCSNKEELVRLQKRSSAEATPPGAAARSGGAGQQGSVTRALGFTEAKRQAGKRSPTQAHTQ